MATITLTGNPIHTSGGLPPIGSQAPDFVLVDAALNDVTLATYAGKKKLLNIVPSLDTPVCAMSTRRFSAAVKDHPQAVFLMVSADLPFAMSRFCKAEGTENVISLSLMRSRDFARDYGVLIEDGPLAGITARAVIVLDAADKVIYTQLVPEIAHEPDYDLALAALRG
ncbi:MAG: thiol peroxidase [Gammaproteobacteria bacterium]